jgi:hypothetical protein
MFALEREVVLLLINVNVVREVLGKIVRKLVALVNSQQTSMFVVQEEIVPIQFVLVIQDTLEVNVRSPIVLEFLQLLQMFVHPMENVYQLILVFATLDTLESTVTFKIALEKFQQTPMYAVDVVNALVQINANVMLGIWENNVKQLIAMGLHQPLLLFAPHMANVWCLTNVHVTRDTPGTPAINSLVLENSSVTQLFVHPGENVFPVINAFVIMDSLEIIAKMLLVMALLPKIQMFAVREVNASTQMFVIVTLSIREHFVKLQVVLEN